MVERAVLPASIGALVCAAWLLGGCARTHSRHHELAQLADGGSDPDGHEPSDAGGSPDRDSGLHPTPGLDGGVAMDSGLGPDSGSRDASDLGGAT